MGAKDKEEVDDEEFITHKITSTVSHSSERVYEFSKLTDAFKVRQKGINLDYWVYDINLQTNDEAYWDPPHTTGLVKICTTRRYSEFEWLRKEMVAYYPGAIIPNLPGLKMEGLLDKVKSLLMPETEKEPPIVVFRKRGLSLFLKWIQESPLLRGSPIMQGFAQTNPREFEAFKKKWNEDKKKDPMFTRKVDAAKYNAKRLATRKKNVLPDRLEAVRTLADSMTSEMLSLKDAVEDLWEIQGQSRACYPLYPHLDVDDCTHALLECGRDLDAALNAKEADTAYAKLLVLLSFYHGLCKSVLEAIKTIEGLTYMLEEAKKDSSASLPSLEQSVETSMSVFYDELAHWHAFRRELCRRIPKKFCWLGCHMDPTMFDWTRANKIIAELPDAYADVDEGAENNGSADVNLGAGNIGDGDL